jgi:two-component system response regulator PilR (NtrC family)
LSRKPIRKVKERLPEQIIMVITGYASLETSVKAFRAGAYDYVIKPIINEEIKQIVKNALRQKAIQKKDIIISKHDERQYDFNNIIGESPW